MAYRILTVVLATTSACAPSSGGTQPETQSTGALAFVVRDPASNGHEGNVCVLGVNTMTCFTPEVGFAGSPAWSRDGSLLAYQTLEDNYSAASIRVMNADGSASHEVTAGTRIEDGAAWSPTRDELVFSSGGSLFRGAASGSQVVQLTTETQDGNPTWAGDGESIVFVSYRAGFANIGKLYAMARDGSNVHRVTSLPPTVGEANPRFSPDGTTLTFETYTYEVSQHTIWGGPTYLANADGTNLRDANLWLQEPIADAPLALYWSPDMTQLAYASQAANDLRVVELADNPPVPRTLMTGMIRGTLAWDPCTNDQLAVRVGWIETRRLVIVDVPNGTVSEVAQAGNVDGHFAGLSWSGCN